jgi:hypothetical protein
METFMRITGKVGMLLLFWVALGGFPLDASAAPICFTAKLYIGPNCTDCVRIQRDASTSIAALVQAERLEVVTLDTEGSFVGYSLPDFQVFHPDTDKLVELYQVDPIGIVPEGLLVRNVSEVSSRLNEIAQQEECTPSSLLPELSARGVSPSILDTMVEAIASFILRLF